MTKLSEREPKSGDKFLHRNQSISSFGALLPEIVEQRLVVIKGSDNDIEFYNYPSGKYDDVIDRWKTNGRYYSSEQDSLFDLFYALHKKVEKTFWIAVFPDEIQDKYLKPSDLYNTKEEAMEIDRSELCQIVPITLMVEE